MEDDKKINGAGQLIFKKEKVNRNLNKKKKKKGKIERKEIK